MDIKVRIHYAEDFDGTGVWIYRRGLQGIEIAAPVELKFLPHGIAVSLPLATFQFENGVGTQFLQSFAEALNQAGFVTTAVKDSKAELTATRYHLEDMRRLVMNANYKEPR